MDRIEIIERDIDTEHTEYRWHRKAGNGEILCSGEGHTRREDASRAAERATQPIWPLVGDIELLAEINRRMADSIDFRAHVHSAAQIASA